MKNQTILNNIFLKPTYFSKFFDIEHNFLGNNNAFYSIWQHFIFSCDLIHLKQQFIYSHTNPTLKNYSAKLLNLNYLFLSHIIESTFFLIITLFVVYLVGSVNNIYFDSSMTWRIKEYIYYDSLCQCHYR